MRWVVHAREEFTASHALRVYNGRPEEPHSHRWAVEVRVGVPRLNAEGYALDFHALRSALAAAVADLHDADLTAHPEVGTPTPTAENLAMVLARRLEEPVALLGGTLLTVTVWEGPGNRVDLELEG